MTIQQRSLKEQKGADMKAKFVMIGYGWRADFFYRIVKELPEQFEITGAVLRTKERAKEVAEREKVFATDDLEKALDTKPDFVVLCVPRAITKEYLIRLMEKNIPVLCETPPGKDTQELKELWEKKKELNGKIQIVEQYFLQPLYASWVKAIQQGYIGEVSNMSLSALHGYHAVSIFRKMLGTGFRPCTIQGRRYQFPVIGTNGRAGLDTSGTTKMADRDMAVLEFDNKKVAFLDFTGEQYFSHIRTRRLNIQGLKGEINDMEIRYLNENNRGVTETLHRLDAGIYNNSGWSHEGIMLGREFLYQNPFYGAKLNDDEIAVADCLKHMKAYVDTGKDFYSLQEALWDTYLSFLINKAIETGKSCISEPLFDI